MAGPDLAQAFPDPNLMVSGDDSFIYGMNGYTAPLKLSPGEYVNGMNLINRGGVAQTRPGSESLLNLPAGNLQGMTYFRPANGVVYLVVAVEGKVYASPAPFTTYAQIPHIQFAHFSRFISWASCVKSTDYTADGVLYFLPAPYPVLIMQDGNTRAAYWDGSNSGHLNPTPTPAAPQTLNVLDATNVTPIVLTLDSNIIGATGEVVHVTGVVGNDAANGTYTITVIDPTHISLNGSTGNGEYVSGGQVVTDPTASGNISTLPGYDETLIGLWSAWSNNRLWISRDNMIFASDIGNPMKFTEAQYLNEGRAFYLPGNCTGVAEISDRSGIICFTADQGIFLQTSVQDRTQWLSTPGFQTTILPNIGCASPRSIVQQYGLVWWFTSRGLMNQNNALSLNISSRMDIQDNEMIQSKYNLSYDLLCVCGSYIENFLFHAVPNGDKINTRLHVLDQAPFDDAPQNSWPSYWEGWRPVEFARGVIAGKERVFCASQDFDGVNRVWELFKAEKTDNGIPITSFVVTRPYVFDNRDWKRFNYAEIEMQNLVGDVAVMAAVSGLRGAFQPIMVKDISATEGQVYADSQYGFNANVLNGTKVQTRVLRTQQNSAATDCNGACVESNISGLVDKAFNLLVAWSGVGGVNTVRMFAQQEALGHQGDCEQDETGEDNLLTPSGCGSNSKFSTSEPFTVYSSSATFTRNDPATGLPVTKTATQTSLISQVDADRKAQAMAEWYVLHQIGEIL